MPEQPTPKNVGLVELSDEAIEVLGQYTRDPQWHVAIVVSSDPNANAARMAKLLNAHLAAIPSMDDLAGCHRVVLGCKKAISPAMIQSLRSQGIEIYVWNGDDVARRPDSGEAIPVPPLAGENFSTGLPADDCEPCEPVEREARSISHEMDPCPGESPEEEPAEAEASPSLVGDRSPWPWRVDPKHPILQGMLEELRQTTKAQTASIMLPNEDGSKLSMAASVGFDGGISEPAQETNRGLAWDCYSGGEPKWIESSVPGFAETADSHQTRVSVSVPIKSERRVAGVISVNLDVQDSVLPQELVEQVEPFAQLAFRQLIKSIHFEGMNTEDCCQTLMHVIDRIMSMDENLAVRLQDAGEVIAQALAGDYVHVLLVDFIGRRLELVTPQQGIGVGSKHLEMDRGFYGWVLRQESPKILEAVSSDGSERRANAYMPILSNQPCGLVVIENLRMERFERDGLLPILENVGNLLGEMLNVEEGMGAQELLSDIKMRIADASSSLEGVSEHEKALSMLNLTVDLTTAYTALWIPSLDSRPVTLKPSSPEAQRIISESLFNLDTLVNMTYQHQSMSWGLGGEDAVSWPEGWEPPASVAAMQESDGSGVLLLFFAGADAKASTAQMPLQSIFDVMSSVLQLMAQSQAA